MYERHSPARQPRNPLRGCRSGTLKPAGFTPVPDCPGPATQSPRCNTAIDSGSWLR